VSLTGANMIAKLGAFTTSNAAFSLTDAETLTVDGAVNAGSGALTADDHGAPATISRSTAA